MVIEFAVGKVDGVMKVLSSKIWESEDSLCKD